MYISKDSRLARNRFYNILCDFFRSSSCVQCSCGLQPAQWVASSVRRRQNQTQPTMRRHARLASTASSSTLTETAYVSLYSRYPRFRERCIRQRYVKTEATINTFRGEVQIRLTIRKFFVLCVKYGVLSTVSL